MTTTIEEIGTHTRWRQSDGPGATTRFVPGGWIDVCPASAIRPETGVCVLVGKDQIAIFRLHNGSLLAIGNVDPFSGAAVLSRGIVGDTRGIPKVASPLYKQAFDLRTGVCLDDPSVRVPVYLVRQVEESVQVQACPVAVFTSPEPGDCDHAA